MTPLASQDLEALKALAEKATGGDWTCGRDLSHFDAPELVKADGAFYVGVKMEDAAFIAAFNPQTALALIAHITALEAEKAAARRLANLSENLRRDANQECFELRNLLLQAQEHVCSMNCRSVFPAGHVKSDADHIALCRDISLALKERT